jgi:DNA-directed RNA polymerase subunit M/transcription elongation factor TFIIS
MEAVHCPKCRRTLTTEGRLVYCQGCGYETPESKARAAEPPKAEPAAAFEVMSTAALGRACVSRMRELVEAIGEERRRLEAQRAEGDRRIGALQAEGAKLTAIARFCETVIPPELAIFKRPAINSHKGEKVPPGSTQWTCRKCGYGTSNRAAAAHKLVCPMKDAS